VSAVGDPEDSRPLERPRTLNHANPTFPPDPPIPVEARKTLTPEEANQAVMSAALMRFSEAVESFTQILPTLATKEQLAELTSKVSALDAGLRMLSAGQEEIARNVLDIKAAIEGEGGIIQKLDGLEHLGKSAYDLAASHHRQNVGAEGKHASIAPELTTAGSGRPAG
jgi:hypothetical protein